MDRTDHSTQGNAELIGQLLADSFDAAVSQMVYVIHTPFTFSHFDEKADNLDNVIHGKNRIIHWYIQIELLVKSIAAYLSQVIFLGAEKDSFDKFLGGLQVGRLTGP